MSGLYNMIFGDGQEELRGSLLGLNLLGLEREAFARYRDAWIEKLDDGTLRLAFYTRNGGDNADPNIDVMLSAHPEFLYDQEDTYDNTYRTYYFNVPTEPPPYHQLAGIEGWDADEYTKVLDHIRDMASEPINMSEKWEKALKKQEEQPPADIVDLSKEIYKFLRGSDPDQ